MATFGWNGGSMSSGDLIAMPTVYNTPTSFLGGGIHQGNIGTGAVNQHNGGFATGGSL